MSKGTLLYTIEFRVPRDRDQTKIRDLAKKAAKMVAKGAETQEVVIYTHDYYVGHGEIMMDD